jgi:hypothetical protein
MHHDDDRLLNAFPDRMYLGSEREYRQDRLWTIPSLLAPHLEVPLQRAKDYVINQVSK